MSKKSTPAPATNNEKLTEIVVKMAAARKAERTAKTELITMIKADASITDAILLETLKSNGYNEKKASNMVKSYRGGAA